MKLYSADVKFASIISATIWILLPFASCRYLQHTGLDDALTALRNRPLRFRHPIGPAVVSGFTILHNRGSTKYIAFVILDGKSDEGILLTGTPDVLFHGTYQAVFEGYFTEVTPGYFVMDDFKHVKLLVGHGAVEISRSTFEGSSFSKEITVKMKELTSKQIDFGP